MTNIKRSVLFVGIFAAGLLLYVACNETIETPPIDPEITYDLEEVEGAQNADMTLSQGEAVGRDSWFEVDLSGIESNNIIANGISEGWCVEWQKNIAQNGDLHNGVRMYSTEGKDRWKPLNYLLTIKDRLQREDSDLTFREIQAAIWSVVDGSDFDVDMPADEMPPRLTTDGQPNFDREKVMAIVNKVQANASSHTFDTGSKHAVFISASDNDQTVTVPSEPEQDSVSHGFVEGVTPSDDPQFEERTYPVIQADWEGPGGDKKWLGLNLGATEEPEAINDERPESAGWYFQFNRKQGYYHDGTDRIPATEWEDPIEEESDWIIDNDPCRELLGESWRIPTADEWEAFHAATSSDEGGDVGTGDTNAAFESILNLHLAGFLRDDGEPNITPPRNGMYWSSNGVDQGVVLTFGPTNYLVSAVLKSFGVTIRCIES